MPTTKLAVAQTNNSSAESDART